MPNYSYVALDSNGKEQMGFVQASSQPAAISTIKEMGLFPTKVEQTGEEGGKAKKGKKAAAKGGKGGAMSMNIRIPGLGGKVKPKHLMILTRQLATLINAGMPLLRCLHTLDKQEKNPLLKRTLNELGTTIESGGTFAESLASHPKIFNKLYVNMVKAGELGGVMDVILLRLAEFMEKSQKIKSKVISAMVYPIVVLTMAMVIMTFLMIKVVPKFEEIFKDLFQGDASLPGLTQFVMNISRAMQEQFVVIAVGVVGLVIGLKILGKTPWGSYGLDKAKLSMPLFGSLIRMTAISRFTRTLGTLLSSGVPILQALTIVKDTAGNQVISNAVDVVHDAVKEGENVAPPMDSTGVFPPVVISMVEVGEETGELPDMLVRIADNYDGEVDDVVAGLTSVIEPILIIFLALIVGTIVIALFLPLIQVIGNLSG